MPQLIDTSAIDKIITGRVEPHIYAFKTQTIPNYLKVGDTYRPVETRLNEWRRYFPNLVCCGEPYKAKTIDGRIFRDYAVHSFLENDRKRTRLIRGMLPLEYYSNEFFANATLQDVVDAIDDINQDSQTNGGKYQFYSENHLPEEYHYQRNQTYDLRPNQKETVDNFKTAIENGRKNLLMYAVMRFGKSFTAMCCSLELSDCNITLIVSAKADVAAEWKQTVESHVLFADYTFLDKNDLSRDGHIITNNIESGKRVAIFLTLQDLQGEEIKSKHKEIFESNIDLLIVDETHYGARASQLGKILQTIGVEKKSEIRSEIQDIDEEEDSDKNEIIVKALNARIKLHLSGTPYRILMGDEFEKEDIIAFCQFTDIVELQQQWEELRIENDEHDCNGIEIKEWENPYFGFPQMVRFAFKPNESALAKMRELKEHGCTYAFSALFKPKSIKKSVDGSHKKFVHSAEILDMLSIIDGSKDDANILGFLDYDKIKEGNMCRHIVIVLPYRASCDALEELINANKSKFRNLSDYEIINISGVDRSLGCMSNDDVKRKIADSENNGVKTITLTVNRMLTGSTVQQWDTMLYLKDTASPQEYDQSIFRLQNQFIKTYQQEDGEIVKYNMKPQTLLVDFDPDRMFRMQELKSQFYNANTDERGNSRLEERLTKELQISPIFTLNHNRLCQVTPTNIMDAVRNYSQNKSIVDESLDIPFDKTLLDIDAIRHEIENLNAIDNTKGIEIRPISDEDVDDLDVPDETSGNPSDSENSNNNTEGRSEDEADALEKKLATYYSKILFFAFLTDNRVKGLRDVINQIQHDVEDHRIAKNLGLKLRILNLLQSKTNVFILSKLDYKIQSINDLMRDASLEPIKRAEIAMTKFARLSNSEVVTPSLLADELVALIPEKDISDTTIFLDIATVQGEMVCAIYKKYGELVRNNIFSVPTSSLTFELTRKVYKLLGLPITNILSIYATDLLKEGNEEVIKSIVNLHPDIVCGVPPFSESMGGGRGDGGSAIYHKYFNFAKDIIRPRYIAMMMQSTWYTGGRGDGLDDFRNYMLSINTADKHIKELHDYPNIEAYVKGVTTLRGGVCLFLWDGQYDGDCYFINRINHHDYPMMRPLRFRHGDYQADFLIRWNRGLSILHKVLDAETSFIPDDDMMRRRNPFGFPSDSSDNWLIGKKKSRLRKTLVYLVKGKTGYALDSEFTKEKDGLLNQWKVFIAKSSPGGDEIPHLVISDPIVAKPGTATANTHYTITGVANEIEATNLPNYMKTKFFRFMVNLLRSNQNMRVDMYRFAPRLDFTRTWSDEQLFERYHLDSDDIEFIKMIIKNRYDSCQC